MADDKRTPMNYSQGPGDAPPAYTSYANFDAGSSAGPSGSSSQPPVNLNPPNPTIAFPMPPPKSMSKDNRQPAPVPAFPVPGPHPNMHQQQPGQQPPIIIHQQPIYTTPPPNFTTVQQTFHTQPSMPVIQGQIHPHPQSQQQIIIVTTQSPGTPLLPHQPTGPVQCPHCRAIMQTRIVKQAGLMSWVIGGACCLAGCGLGCCLLPFCMDEFRDTVHVCSACGGMVGVRRRM